MGGTSLSDITDGSGTRIPASAAAGPLAGWGLTPVERWLGLWPRAGQPERRGARTVTVTVVTVTIVIHHDAGGP